MRGLRVLTVGVCLLVGLIGAVPSASAGGPPEDSVNIIGPTTDLVDCDGVSITRTVSGCVGVPADTETPTFYHLTWVYANDEGDAWTYIDTGVIRTFER